MGKSKSCKECGGTGRIGILGMVNGKPTRVRTATCPTCNGTGRLS